MAVAAPPPAKSSGGGADPSTPKFDVEAYDVDGNTLLDQLSIEKAVYPYMGPDRSAADIEAARKALEDIYHGRGYQTVQVEIPPQTVADRIVRLHVVEIQVGRLRVTGSRFYSLEAVKRATPALAEGEVPNLQDAAAQIADLNRIPGRQVTPIIRQGKIPGTEDIDLKVTDQNPVHASLELSNDHNADTTPLRLTASFHYDNLWQLGHSLSFSYAVAPKNRLESEVFAGSYLAPLPSSHWSVLVYGYHSNSNVATIGDVDVLGRGWTVGARGIDELPALGPVSESLSIGFDFKHSFQYLLPGQAQSTATHSAIDYVPLNVVYSLQLDTASSSSHASLGVTAGISGLTGSGGADYAFEINRLSARSNFIHANLDLEHTQGLPFGLEGDLRITAQGADGPLLSGEQFSAGGLTSVRGYLQSAAVGDEGVFSSAELRSPLLTFAPRWLIDDWRLFIFNDIADTRLIEPLADQKREFFLDGAGLGERFEILGRLDGTLVVAVPLYKAVGSDERRPYAQFSLKAGF